VKGIADYRSTSSKLIPYVSTPWSRGCLRPPSSSTASTGRPSAISMLPSSPIFARSRILPTEELDQVPEIPTGAETGVDAKKDLAFLGYT